MPGYLIIDNRPTQNYSASFCDCKSNDRRTEKLHCTCGEEQNGMYVACLESDVSLDNFFQLELAFVHTENEWAWNEECTNGVVCLNKDRREVVFHPYYSSGTAVVRGDTPFLQGYNYYWEIKVLTPLYGTDVMIGVGTSKVNLQDSLYSFRSLLGLDGESWGYSYFGCIQHGGRRHKYGAQYDRGSIIGVHLDMWKGTLEFYLNRKPLGIAFSSLHGKVLYPMISSTAARSSMRVICSSSAAPTLQLLCLQAVGKCPDMVMALNTVPLFSSVINSRYWWLLSSHTDTPGNCRSRQVIETLHCCDHDCVMVSGESNADDDDDDLGLFCANLSHNYETSDCQSAEVCSNTEVPSGSVNTTSGRSDSGVCAIDKETSTKELFSVCDVLF